MSRLRRAPLLVAVALASHPTGGARALVAPRPAATAAPPFATAPPSPASTSSTKRRSLSAEVAYPRSAAEAATLGGQALLLVSATTTNSADLPLDAPTLHLDDGRALTLVRVAGQTDDDGTDPSDPAAVRFAYSGLYYLPLVVTARSAQVTVVFGGTRQVVAQFPRPASAYPVNEPMPPPGVSSTRVMAAFASKRYPFFRIPPLKQPAKEPTCPKHPLDPPAASAVGTEQNDKTAHKAPAKGDEGAGGNPRGGSLLKEVIRGVIHAHVDEVRGCYEHELVEHNSLRGRVMVRFTIRRDGWVADSVLQSSTLPSPLVSDCIVATVRCWRFPAPRGGGTVIVSYPFNLEPMEYGAAPKPSTSGAPVP